MAQSYVTTDGTLIIPGAYAKVSVQQQNSGLAVSGVIALVGESTGTPFAAQKVNIGTWTPTAAVWYTVRVQLGTNAGICKIFDTDVPSRPVLVANGERGLPSLPEGGTAVRPHLYFRTRNTTPKVVDLDFIRCWQDR